MLGEESFILIYNTSTDNVYSYDKSYKPLEEIQIVTGATAYDDEVTGTTYLLRFYKVLWYGLKLDH